jgi:hypothetical protein
MPMKKRIAKMVGGSVCPPGVWCMDTSVIVCVLLTVVVIGGLLYVYGLPHKMMAQSQPQKPTVIVVEKQVVQPPQVSQVPVDPRFAPLSPEQVYNPPPDLRGFPTPPLSAGLGIPINQITRSPGYPDMYQQVGVLTAPGGTETSASPTRTILPLFGRKLMTNRDRWNYYTRTDGINPVQVPLEFKRRKCDDDHGCEEITTGDSVSCPILGQSYVANVYQYSTPRYLPF